MSPVKVTNKNLIAYQFSKHPESYIGAYNKPSLNIEGKSCRGHQPPLTPLHGTRQFLRLSLLPLA